MFKTWNSTIEWNDAEQKVVFSALNIFGKNTEKQSLTVKSFSLVLHNQEKKSESVPAPECQTMMEKETCIYIYVTEEICTIDGKSGLIISCLFSRQPRWISRL